MFAGTARFVEKIAAGMVKVGFYSQGAKHSAQKIESEGFCVFDDRACAALAFKRLRLMPL
jgi:acetoin utilization deacetylase AcuC-like enzyme